MTTVRFTPGTRYDNDRKPIRDTWAPFDVDDCFVQPLGSDETPGRGRDTTVSLVRIHIEEKPQQPIPLTADVIVRGQQYRVTSVDEWADEFADDADATVGVVVDAVRALGGGRSG